MLHVSVFQLRVASLFETETLSPVFSIQELVFGFAVFLSVVGVFWQRKVIVLLEKRLYINITPGEVPGLSRQHTH